MYKKVDIQLYNYTLISTYSLWNTVYKTYLYKKYKNFAKTDWYVYETLAFLHYSTESYTISRDIIYINKENVYIKLNRIIRNLISRVKKSIRM